MSDDLVKRLLEPCLERGLDELWIDAQRKEAADRIEELEAQVRAADALAEALEAYENAAVDHMDFQADLDAALATYRATKEGPAASDLRAQGYMKYIRADRIEELEAKLAKAVEVAEKSIKWLRLYGADVHREAATLTELTGGKDE